MLPDPQIQSFRAMRAGAIAFGIPTPAVHEVGVVKEATAQPRKAVNAQVDTVAAQQALDGTPAEAPVVTAPSFLTTLSHDVLKTIGTLNAVIATESLSGTPAEAPTIGVGISTSVV